MKFFFKGNVSSDSVFNTIPGGPDDTARFIKGAINEALKKLGVEEIELTVEATLPKGRDYVCGTCDQFKRVYDDGTMDCPHNGSVYPADGCCERHPLVRS